MEISPTTRIHTRTYSRFRYTEYFSATNVVLFAFTLLYLCPVMTHNPGLAQKRTGSLWHPVPLKVSCYVVSFLRAFLHHRVLWLAH